MLLVPVLVLNMLSRLTCTAKHYEDKTGSAVRAVVVRAHDVLPRNDFNKKHNINSSTHVSRYTRIVCDAMSCSGLITLTWATPALLNIGCAVSGMWDSCFVNRHDTRMHDKNINSIVIITIIVLLIYSTRTSSPCADTTQQALIHCYLSNTIFSIVIGSNSTV